MEQAEGLRSRWGSSNEHLPLLVHASVGTAGKPEVIIPEVMIIEVILPEGMMARRSTDGLDAHRCAGHPVALGEWNDPLLGPNFAAIVGIRVICHGHKSASDDGPLLGPIGVSRTDVSGEWRGCEGQRQLNAL